MRAVHDYINYNKPISLHDNFPPGMFLPDGNPDEIKAWEMIGTIDKLILEGTARNQLLQKFSLLQIVPRTLNEYEVKNDSNLDLDDFNNYYKNLLRVLTPDWYNKFTDMLSESQAEIYFKNYLVSHETWGSSSGITSLVKTMLENDADRSIKINIKLNPIDRRKIDSKIVTTMGKQNSRLGIDFLAGKDVNCKPRHLDIYIGPIFYMTLEKLQQAGWASGTNPDEKLTRLIELALPYYFNPRIHILLATEGFTIGKSILGKDRLGVAFTMTD
jgi:hypothetical protein